MIFQHLTIWSQVIILVSIKHTHPPHNVPLQPDAFILWRTFWVYTWNGCINIIADIDLSPPHPQNLSQWCKCVALNKGCDNYGYKVKFWHARVPASSYLDIKQDFRVVQRKGTGKRRPLSMTALAPAGQEAASSEDENTPCFLCFRKKLGPSWRHKTLWCLKTSVLHIHTISSEIGGGEKRLWIPLRGEKDIKRIKSLTIKTVKS